MEMVTEFSWPAKFRKVLFKVKEQTHYNAMIRMDNPICRKGTKL